MWSCRNNPTYCLLHLISCWVSKSLQIIPLESEGTGKNKNNEGIFFFLISVPIKFIHPLFYQFAFFFLFLFLLSNGNELMVEHYCCSTYDDIHKSPLGSKGSFCRKGVDTAPFEDHVHPALTAIVTPAPSYCLSLLFPPFAFLFPYQTRATWSKNHVLLLFVLQCLLTVISSAC